MARTFRFFTPTDVLNAGVVTLDTEEAHHALHVARIRVGESVEVFDGAGSVGQCTVSAVGRRTVSLEVQDISKEPEPEHRLILCMASLNRERTMEAVIEGCVPLGTTEFVVFGSDHSERKPVLNPKWKRWAREACKQSLRNWMPKFSVTTDLNAALDAYSGLPTLVLTPDAREYRLPLALERSTACACVVGPEGGLSEDELALASSRGAIPIGLGRNILRTEAACTTISALVTYVWRSSAP